MSSCPNKSHPAWKALVEQTGSEIEAYKEYINNDFSIPFTGVELNEREIKPGVSELFDSNPELANAAYEALGFNQLITPNDRIVFGHPTIGKSYLKKQGEGRFITLDDDYKDEVNAFVDANRGSETRQEYKGRKPKEYNEFMLNLYDRLKVQAQREGKILFVSNTNILKERMSDFDKVITIPKAEFKRRFDERGATYGFEDWKSDIDATVAKVPSNKVITTTGYLADLFITPQQKQQALQLYSQYIDTIFPNSKVKDIVYHGSPDGRFDSFDVTKAGKTTFQPTQGVYFTDSKKTADFYAEGSIDYSQFESLEEYEAVKTAKIFTVILNASELRLVDNPQAQEKQGDAILRTKNKLSDIGFVGEPDYAHQYIVFKPEQIHILGDKQDLEEFKKFVSSDETMLQKEGTETSTASPQTISMIKDFLKRIGVDIKPMQQIVVNGIRQDANGAALIMQKLIQVMEGKEASALPEEAMHFAVEIIKQTNPAFYKTLLREINNYAILKNVFADYATDPAYQTKDGKPDVIKLKEEAIAKVLADTIIKKSEGVIEKPENLQKTLNWWEKITEWLKGLFLKSGFDQAAMDIISGKSIGTANDIRADIDATFLQKAGDPQTTIFNNIKEVASRIKPKKVMVDGEEVEKYFIDGKMIDRRVTQLAKDWYSRQRDQKDLTKSEYQTALDDLKKEKGTLGHKYLELAFNMFIDENGFVRAVPLNEATAFSKIPVAERAVFKVLKDNLQERINTINAEGGGKVRFMSEVTIYDPKRSIAGTVDFLAITPEGKTYVLDWKFMAIKTEKFKDIPWYNVNSWRIQMEQYKLILRSVYGVKVNDFVQTRMIPIQAIYKGGDPKNNVLPTLDEVKIGDVTVKNIAEDFLLPLSLAEETTGTKKLDTLIGKLNAVYKKFSERRVLPSEKLDKNEQLNTLFQAIRHLQMKNDLRPLLRQAKILNIQINKIIDRYNNEFKGKDAKSFTEQQINEFSADLITAQDSLRTYITLDVDLEFLFPKTPTEEDIALKNDLIATAGAARTLMNDIEGEDGVINEFAQDIVAKSESVNSLLSSEKIIKGFTRYFGSTSTLQNRSIQLLYKKANKAFYYSGTDTLAENRKLLALKEAFDKWARGKGLTSKNYFSLIKKKGKNELIDEFNPEFFSTLKKKIETKDYEWVRQNINVPEYNQALSKKLEEEIQRILDKPRVFDNPADVAKMDLYNQTKNLADLPGEIIFEIREKQALYNTSTTESPGWLLYDLANKHPAEKWMSKEWKELHAKDASGNYINKPALDFFNYIKEKNEEYRDLGYIRRDSARVFLPFVRKSFAEKLVTKGQLRLGEQFFRSISIDEGDVGFGQTDPLTGKPIDVIPKYFTTAVEGEMSEDLFKTMAFYNESAIRYKYLKQIENQLQLISGVERNKKAIATSFFGKTDYVDDVLQYTPNNNENSKLYDDMMKSIVYGQKFLTSETFDQLLGKLGTWGETLNKKLGVGIFPEGLSQRQLSVNKILNNLNNTFQLSSLGLNLLSASSNFFGGNAQSIINSGKYFTKGDYLASELEIFTQRLNVPNQKKILAALEYFLPLTENYNREFAKKLSLSTMTQESLQDGLMFLMRKSDWNVQTANFLSFLKNSIVENGKVINAREFLRGQPKYENIYAGTVQQRKALENDFEEDVKKLIEDKGILKVSQIVNNELVIPGVDQKSDSVIDFRRKVQSLTKDALGNLSEDDVRMINMSVYGKSFMVFKNWIPRLVDVRMGNLKYNSASDAYEWGRTRMIFRVIKEDWWRSLRNLQGSLVANERGVEFMRDLYEKKKYDYERDTGKELDMTEAQFMDLVRGNIKSQVIDLIFYTTMLILVAGIKDLPDDEEDPAVKNQYRYFIKMADKFKDEISYFYDPTALLKTVSGNVFPAISLIENFRKGFGNFFIENWAIMEGDQETVDDVYVIKYLMKTFPFTNQMVGYLPMFYPEMAKDLGIKMQKNYGIK